MCGKLDLSHLYIPLHLDFPYQGKQNPIARQWGCPALYRYSTSTGMRFSAERMMDRSTELTW